METVYTGVIVKSARINDTPRWASVTGWKVECLSSELELEGYRKTSVRESP